jgi:hypothetical protein
MNTIMRCRITGAQCTRQAADEEAAFVFNGFTRPPEWMHFPYQEEAANTENA